MTTLAAARRPYCVGIGGIGVSAIAQYFLATDRRVAGTDLASGAAVDAVRRQGAAVKIGEPPATFPSGTDLVIFSDAPAPDHPLRIEAARRGLATLSYAEALGQLLGRFQTRIVVAGTNGKSTTTALTGWLLTSGGLDPSIVVGSLVPQLGGNFRFGRSNTGLAEGDEYLGHFLHLKPTTAIITNIEWDHPDVFRSLDEVVIMFQKFCDALSPAGTLCINADDPISTTRLSFRQPQVQTFSLHDPRATLLVTTLGESPAGQRLRLTYRDAVLGDTTLILPGAHNRANAAAAALTALSNGVSGDVVLQQLATFQGLWRRFEMLGTINDAPVISDYAHHPTAVAGLLAAARERFPTKKIILAFQPHHKKRLRELETAFASAFDQADEIFLCEVFAVPGREAEKDASVSVKPLADAVARRGKEVHFVERLEELASLLRAAATADAVVLIAGAGKIDSVARQML